MNSDCLSNFKGNLRFPFLLRLSFPVGKPTVIQRSFAYPSFIREGVIWERSSLIIYMSLYSIGLLSITEVFGDFALKKYANEGGLSYLAYGVLGYVGVVYFLVQSLRGSSVLMVNAAWDGISAFIESVLAFVVLGERFSDPNQYIGIGLIVAGLFFLKIPLNQATRSLIIFTFFAGFTASPSSFKSFFFFSFHFFFSFCVISLNT